MATQKTRSKTSPAKKAAAKKAPTKKPAAKKAPTKKAAASKKVPAKAAATKPPVRPKKPTRPTRPPKKPTPPRRPGGRDMSGCDFPPSWLLGTFVTDPVPGIQLPPPDGRFFALDDLVSNQKIVGLCLGVSRGSPPGESDPRVQQSLALGDYLKSAGVYVRMLAVNEEIVQSGQTDGKSDGSEPDDK